MARPMWRQIIVRSWEFRPGSAGVLVMTAGVVLWSAALDWPAWVCALGVVVLAAGVAALLAALELSNEADDAGEEDGAPPAGGAFAVGAEGEDGRRVTLKPESDDS